MSIYKKGIRSYGKGIWQLKILCDDQLYYIKAVSKQEAEEKYNCLLKGYKKFSRPISLTVFDCYLKQSGFPAGTERVLIKRKKKSAHKLSTGSWRSSFTYNKTRIYLIGASEKEAEKKMLITRNAVEQGLCEGTLEGAHEYLVNAGYEFGRFSSARKKTKSKKKKHGSFKNNVTMISLMTVCGG